MPTKDEYIYNVKLPNSTYWSGPKSQLPSGGVGGEIRSATSFSSEKGADLLNKSVDNYNKLIAPPPKQEKATDTVKTEKPTSTYINPATEQSATITTDDQQAGKSLMSKGYQFAEGGYPSWQDDDADTQKLKLAEQDLVDAQGKLKNFSQAMSTDPALKGILDGISAQWESRVAEMRRVNMQRTGAINTTGVRLGSRYTGGSGGMFGGIIAEEERQGVERIGQLEAAKNAALAEARSAYEAQEWDRYVDLVNIAEKNYEKQAATVAELQKAQAAQEAKIKEQVTRAQRDSTISDLFTQGVTDPADMLNTLNYDEKGRLVGDFSAEEVKNVFDFIAKDLGTNANELSGDAKNFYSLKNLGLLPASISSLPDEDQFLSYIKQTNDAARAPEKTRIGVGGGTPQDFEDFTREQVALSVIPVQLRNTEVELNRFLEGIRGGLAQGFTPFEIADKLMGYTVNNPDRFSTALRQYFSTAEIDASTISNVARLINSGNKVQALNELETRVMARAKKESPDFFISESNTDYFVSNARKLQLMVEALEAKGGSPVGEFSGTFNKWLGRFKSGDAQKIATQATQLYAEMRNRLAGTAVTTSEGNYLEPLIPRLEDDPDNFLSKVKQLQSDSLTRLNRVRSQYNLPALDATALRSKDARIGLYESTIPQETFDDPLNLEKGKTDDPLGLFD